jgi:hypothetical protein
MLRHRMLLMTACAAALIHRAAEADAGSASNQPTDVSAPTDGQIALTARNNGDGTWAVKRGPTGAVLLDGIAHERALAIVGAGPDSITELDRAAYADRQRLEAKSAEITNAAVNKTDEQVAAETVDPVAEIARLEAENAELKAKLAAFDHDGDGDAGGSTGDGGPDDFTGKTVPDLKAIAVERGVDLQGATKRRDIVAALSAADVGGEPEADTTDAAAAVDAVEGEANNGGE